MKRFLKVLTVVVFVCALAVSASAKVKVKVDGKTLSSSGTYLGAKGMGIGLQGGLNNGLVFKSWIDKESALQFDANFGIGWGGGIGVGAAYLIHNFGIIEMTNSKLPLYFGIKGGASFFGTGYYSSGGIALSVQVPLGIAWIPKDYPIDIFAQFEPGLAILFYGNYSYFGWGPGGSAGIRYWFN